jgi:long-subunit acyl-CoA synthetase (AMP-forming)
MIRLLSALAHRANTDGQRLAMSDCRRGLTRSELAAWVGGAAQDLGPGKETVGIFGENSVEWAVAFLAASLAGKTIAPIPTFFSAKQQAHMIRDAGIERIIVTDGPGSGEGPAPASFGAFCAKLSRRRDALRPEEARDGGLIIYTSGSTGNPKGVRLVSGQAMWSAAALARASGASAEDRYLSLLPLPMLLEIICGIMIPVLVGGSVCYDGVIARAIGAGAVCPVAEAFERVRPTTSVLVPRLLALYVGQLAAQGKRAPGELRYVPVGGAPLPSRLASAARALGIPACQGYGISECASVVAVNRPEAPRNDTVGLPLPGLKVEIDDGEIVVEGPSVMDGYLHGEASPRRWRTGDMGSLDPDGFLRVFGRRDNLIITPSGRNVSPEWIENMFLGDPRLEACVLVQAGDPAQLIVLLFPSRAGEGWFETASAKAVSELAAQCCSSAPEYARPKDAIVLDSRESARNLFTANGRIRNSAGRAGH